MGRLPVTLVTGFLGAGKTTLVRRLFKEAGARQRMALLLNELGQAGVDDLGADNARLLELTEGCVCCVQNPDLMAALETLAARGDLDRILLETTGVADPMPLTWTLAKPDVEPFFPLDAVVTVVDALNHAHPHVLDAIEHRRQISGADLVVVSKLDLAPAGAFDTVRALIAPLNPQAHVVDSREPALTELVLGLEPRVRPAAEPSAHAHSHFTFEAFTLPGPVVLEALEDLLEALPAHVYRSKAIVELTDGRWAGVQLVGGRLSLDLDAPRPPHGERRAVFYGVSLDRADLAARLATLNAVDR